MSGDLGGPAPRRADRAARDGAGPVETAGGQRQPGARVGLDDVRRRAAGVPGPVEALHGPERRHPHLDAAPGRRAASAARLSLTAARSTARSGAGPPSSQASSAASNPAASASSRRPSRRVGSHVQARRVNVAFRHHRPPPNSAGRVPSHAARSSSRASCPRPRSSAPPRRWCRAARPAPPPPAARASDGVGVGRSTVTSTRPADSANSATNGSGPRGSVDRRPAAADQARLDQRLGQPAVGQVVRAGQQPVGGGGGEQAGEALLGGEVHGGRAAAQVAVHDVGPLAAAELVAGRRRAAARRRRRA